MKKQVLLAEVRHILLSNVDSRDNDNLLISLVWRKRVSDTPDTKDFLRKLSLGIYPSGETITRLRRKIQEETKPRKDVLVIFEDSLGLNGVFKQSSLIHKYLPNSRHLKTSFIFVSQNYKSIPRLLRNNNSGLILFQTPNDRELMMVYEENSAFLSKDDWMKLYNYIMQGPYNFMYINYQNKKGRQICLNFEKILQIKNIDEE